MQRQATPPPTSSPASTPPESEARRKLQELAQCYYRTGMAQIRTAQDIKRYLAETAPRQIKERP